MKIIKPSYEIMTPIDAEGKKNIYETIERTARTCYKSEDKITEGSAAKLISALVRSEHEAMLEHASITVRFTVDRGVSHELVRHRLASFAQESTRYCVAGDTKLTYSSNALHMTVAELYQNIQKSQNGAWKRIIIRQYNNDTGELQYSKIKGVYYNGIKSCMKVKTRLGYELTCTPDHKILTPDGYKELQELNVGDKVYVNGTNALYKNHDWLFNQSITLNKTFVQIANEFGFNVNTVKKWARKLNIPKKGTGYFHIGHTPWNKGIADERQINAIKKYHHCGRRKDKILKEDTVKYHKHIETNCKVCGKIDGLEVHHIDKNRNNNKPTNLMTVCESCHRRIHYQNLLVAYVDEIIDIEDVGNKDVYDIEMASKYHNFIANGVVVHNCSYDNGKYGSEITYIDIQGGMQIDPVLSKIDPDLRIKILAEWMKANEDAEKHYMKMRELGCPAQMARSVLNNSTKTEIVITASIREWRHILKLRAAGTTGAPHPQMQEVMVQLLNEFADAMPELFDDIRKIYKEGTNT